MLSIFFRYNLKGINNIYNAINYYGYKRSIDSIGVTMPSQIRYIQYFS